MQTRLLQVARIGLFMALVAFASAARPVIAIAAPYAAMVIDARTGKVLHARNADTQLHPASLTKMMTLYLVFQAIENGEISLDKVVTISANAASEPPSKLGLRAGQRIKLRFLIRAAAIKSANDAATALGEAIGGSEAGFVRRMNAMARAMGMTRTTFKNANGLTQSGHLSTARDMTTLGRHLLYDFPQYYNLFSRRSADAGVRRVNNTNRRFLDAYDGADGIKTGYTAAAGFNLVASAKRGNERIIATVFGGRSTASRNAKVAELLDLGFRRAPSNAPMRLPPAPAYTGGGGGQTPAPAAPPPAGSPDRPPAGHIVRVVTAVPTSPRPKPRPGDNAQAPSETMLAAIETGVENAVESVAKSVVVPAPPRDAQIAEAQGTSPVTGSPTTTPPPPPRPNDVTLAAAETPSQGASATNASTPEEPEIITYISTSDGGSWGIDVGRFTTRYDAERVLLKVALGDLSTLGNALRKATNRPDGWHANFVGMSRDAADLACRRLEARAQQCSLVGPG